MDGMIDKLFSKLLRKIHTLLNMLLLKYPSLVNKVGGRFTVLDGFGTPGDTILTATVCRNLKNKFPKLRINCVTPNPDLLRYDPSISELNAPPGLPTIKFWYVDLIAEKNQSKHLLDDTMLKLGFVQYDKQAKFYLTEDEIAAATHLCTDLAGATFITINVQSRERVKTWPTSAWQDLLHLISIHYPGLAVVQLGTDDEPLLGDSVIRLAGKLSIRQSVAVQSLAKLHIGCVSFLMHSANGVNIPSVIIYGGRETPENSGYHINENVYVNLPCSPCWLHDSCGDVCQHNLKCMSEITANVVFASFERLMSHDQSHLHTVRR